MLSSASRKKGSWRKGMMSKTKDAKGRRHLDADYSHYGEKDHHIHGHDVDEKRSPFAKKSAPRIKHVKKPMSHAYWEGKDETKRASLRKSAPKKKKGTWHKGMESKTKDSAGNRHKDAETHRGDKMYHRGGHDEKRTQSGKSHKPFKSVAEAKKVIEKLRGNTKGDAAKLSHLRRAVAYKNAHDRYGKK